MKIKKKLSMILSITILAISLIGCTDSTIDAVSKGDTEVSEILSDTQGVGSDTQSNLVNWGENTHSNSVDPDYDIVFDQSKVLEFNIKIDSEDWQSMQEDLEANIPTRSMNNERPRGNRQSPSEGGIAPEGRFASEGGEPPSELESDKAAPPQGERPQGDREPPVNNQMDTSSDSDYDPIWVESSITFDDTTWDHVGIRFKGNSSLKSAVSSGNNKLSFKLDFDEFEDEYPEINNQRFYGFKQLNLNNNYNDESLMREKVSADLFRDFGVPAANTTFAIVNVDYGQGSEFYGVYTLVEEMDDTGIESQFENDSGNLYKPDGRAASFAAETYNDEEMVKKNNEDEADYSDVIALYDVINRENRLSNLESWKSDLEEVFNVDGFLKWLAANTVMQNWDTYGNMTHNYFLYNNSETNKLEWVPWDNNEALQGGKGNRGALSLGLDEVNNNWPLIDYLYRGFRV